MLSNYLPWLQLLGTFTLFKGIGYSLLKDFTVKGFPDAFNFIGQGKVPGTSIPFQLVIFAVFAVIYFFLLHRTALGRFIYSIGQNENACRYSGVPVDNVKILIFTMSGFMAAVAGMILAARYGSVDADIGSGYELTVITAVVLGGVLTTGGTGTLPGVFLSLWLVSEVRLLMNLLNIQGEIQKIIFGLLLDYGNSSAPVGRSNQKPKADETNGKRTTWGLNIVCIIKLKEEVKYRKIQVVNCY